MFGAAMGIAGLANPVLAGLNRHLLAEVSHRVTSEYQSAAKLARNVSWLLAPFLTMGCVVAWKFGPIITGLIYGEDVQASGRYLAISAIALSTLALGRPLAIYIDATGNTHLTLLAELASCITGLSVGMPGMIKFGFVGALAGVLVGYITMLIVLSMQFVAISSAIPPRTNDQESCVSRKEM